MGKEEEPQLRIISVPLFAAVAACCILIPSVSNATAWNDLKAGNPFLPGYFADPCARKFGDTYFIYATPDGWGGCGEGPAGVWTSKDFVHWT